MSEWQYRKIDLAQPARRLDDVDLLCNAGEEGWELVAILANNVAYLKRELMDSAPKAHPGEATVRNQDVDRDAEVERGGGEKISAVKAKYRDPETQETWSGRGRMANWLKRKLDGGEDIEKYLV